MMIPMVLMDDEDYSSNMKTISMMQTMAQGNRGLDLNTMMPVLLIDDDSEDNQLMRMVLMSLVLTKTSICFCLYFCLMMKILDPRRSIQVIVKDPVYLAQIIFSELIGYHHVA